MGNCVLKGLIEGVKEADEMKIKVVTSNGGIMELSPPITAECITNEFPGHAIYPTGLDGLFSHQPLLHNEDLHAGNLYYLLPLNSTGLVATSQNQLPKNNDVIGTDNTTPYRMSSLKRVMEEDQVLPRYNGSGVWKVKLVISPEQLTEILAQEARTEALIESVRTVAKCGSTYGVSSAANSDQWSVSSSWKASFGKYSSSSSDDSIQGN